MPCVWPIRYISIVLIIFPSFVISHAKENGPIFRQEGAKIAYSNEKYIRDVKVFTYRPRRSSPYLTSINGTSLQWFGNNYTVVFEYTNLRSQSETYAMDFRVCDFLKFSWVRLFVEKYSDLDANLCPVPPATYHFFGFELPPRDFPFPVSQGDYHVKFVIRAARSKERILEIEMDLKLQNKNKG